MTKCKQRKLAEEWTERLRPPESKGQQEQRELIALAGISEDLYFEHQERVNQ